MQKKAPRRNEGRIRLLGFGKLKQSTHKNVKRNNLTVLNQLIQSTTYNRHLVILLLSALL